MPSNQGNIVINKKTKDHTKSLRSIDQLLDEALNIRVKDINHSIKKATVALNNAMDIENDEFIARAKNCLGLFYMIKGDNPKANDFAQKALHYYASKKNSRGEAYALYTLGSTYYKTSNHEKGLELLLKSLDIWSAIGDKANESRNLKVIGYVYEIFDDYENATKNYLRCIKISREIGDKNGESNACNPLSGIYLKQGKLTKAEELIETSIRLKEESGDIRGLAFAYYGKGKVSFKQKRFSVAEKFYLKAIQLHSEMSELLGEGLASRKLGQVYIATDNLEMGEIYTSKALEIAKKINNNDIIFEAHYQLYQISKKRGDIARSLEHFEKYHWVRDKVLNMEISGKIKAREAIHHSKVSDQQAEIERLKNIDLKKAHDEIEIQNRRIKHSIQYAQRIQQAILPSPERWLNEFPESFTLFLPKDIVSGDFYWMKKKENKIFFAAIDCTGHGVPGAMLSMVGYNGLNQLVEKQNLTRPGSILDGLSRFVKLTFKSDEFDLQDGMDMSLCCFDKSNRILQYAGAYNPMYLVRKGKLHEYKADKQPIGEHHSPTSLFSNHTIEIEPLDRVYLFSDGYVDQFGGPDLSKFKSRSFKELILKMQVETMETQGKLLNESFQKWRGNTVQIDDVCVIGIEFQ